MITTFDCCFCFVVFLRKKRSEFFWSLLSVVFGPKTKHIPHKQDPQRKHAEETSSEREKQTLRGQRTRTLFYTERTFVHLESIASVVFIGREWIFSARERFRESFLPPAYWRSNPKWAGFGKALRLCKDDATFCVHLFPSKLTRAIFFHPHLHRSREYFANLAVRWCQKTKPWRGSSLETWLNLQPFAISKRRARTKRILYRRCTERCTTPSLLRFTAKSWECDPERREESENRLAEHRENKRSKSLLHPCRDCCCSILKDFTTTRHDWWYDRTSLFCNV